MKRGFGSPNFDPERAASIHAQGGRASQATGKAHRWSSASAARAGQRGGRLRVFRTHAATCPRCAAVPFAAAYFGNDDADEDLCAAGRALLRRLLEVSAPTPPPVMTHGILGAFADSLESATEPRRACHPKRQHLTRNAALAQRRELLDKGLARNARRIHIYRCDECSRRYERSVFHVGHPAC